MYIYIYTLNIRINTRYIYTYIHREREREKMIELHPRNCCQVQHFVWRNAEVVACQSPQGIRGETHHVVLTMASQYIALSFGFCVSKYV